MSPNDPPRDASARLRAHRGPDPSGTPREERLDRLARLAAAVCAAPVALVSLVDDELQWCAGRVGDVPSSSPRDQTFCAVAVDDAGAGGRRPFVVPDAAVDPRFAALPLVAGPPHLRSYAGFVLHAPDGAAIGTLCVLDVVPRSFEESLGALADVAALAEEVMAPRATDDLLVALDQGVIVCDVDGTVTRMNPAAEQLLGYSAAELSTQWRSGGWETYDEHGQVMPEAERPVLRAVTSRLPVRGEIVGWRRKDGERVLLRLSCVPLDRAAGELVIAFTDITAEHRSRQLLDTTLETAPVGLAVLDVDRTILRCNSMFVRHSGRTAEELIGLDVATLLSEDADRRAAMERADELLATKRLGFAPRRDERRVVHPDGSEHWFTTELAVIADPDQPRAIIATFDVTEQRKMNLELARFEYLFRHANDIITVVDATGTVLYASPSNGRVLGYGDDWDDPGGILGSVHPDDVPKAEAEFAALVAGRRSAGPFTLRVRAASGEWRHLECVGVNLLDEPAVGGIVLTSRDATDRERLTAQLAHSATHDDLTDLANRSLLESQLSGALARALRDDHHVGICFIDLDGFKGVNDTFGHAVGDQLLVEVARRIRGSIRGGDLAARIGGDEFVVMIDPVDGPRDALEAGSRIRDAIVADMSAVAPGLVCGASVGVAVSAIHDAPSSLLRRADGALYRAKALRQSAVELSAELTH